MTTTSITNEARKAASASTTNEKLDHIAKALEHTANVLAELQKEVHAVKVMAGNIR